MLKSVRHCLEPFYVSMKFSRSPFSVKSFITFYDHSPFKSIAVVQDRSDSLPFAVLRIQSIQDWHFASVALTVDRYKIFKHIMLLPTFTYQKKVNVRILTLLIIRPCVLLDLHFQS